MNKTADEILVAMAATFRERNAVYKNNHEAVGKVMESLYPDGLLLKGAVNFDKWLMLAMIIIKITRLVNTNLEHTDSMHDIAVYSAMMEALSMNEERKSA